MMTFDCQFLSTALICEIGGSMFNVVLWNWLTTNFADERRVVSLLWHG